MSSPDRFLRVGDRVLALALADLTTFAADVIVNAANERLVGGGGVDGAIHHAGGPEVMADLRERYGERRHCPTGGAVLSVAGRLPARWVAHAVGPVWHGGEHGEPAALAAAHRAALALCEEVGARSVAFPAISCGSYGYPPWAAAPVAIEAVASHLARPTTIEHATFVLYSRDVFEAFVAALEAR
jgi:O-acetyl-ADP-ribose deacetylase (regulator of RNase III)